MKSGSNKQSHRMTPAQKAAKEQKRKQASATQERFAKARTEKLRAQQSTAAEKKRIDDARRKANAKSKAVRTTRVKRRPPK